MNTETKELLEELRIRLAYFPDTGVFIWLVNAGRFGRIKAGTIAGSKGKHGGGYIEIGRNGALIKAHRLAWAMMKGEWPVNQIDHINRIRSDNRFCNLRQATGAQNMLNKTLYSSNTSGAQGVNWHKATGKWVARIGISGKRHSLGYFKSFDEAIAARDEAKKHFHKLM